ncbi:helix-turn-helix domain-containing protein [Nonomuraea sp. CA-218870]|uniref:helix-turn-helix domain-containing protein n=1 Tax=Nonomuraea sp. CA-218870 TaxID=3239998 RepID=UPI003D916B7D
MIATLKLRRDELAKHRERAALRTDSDLAKAMNVNPVTVSKFLNGHRQPSADLIASLLAALSEDVTFHDLFEVVREETAA